MTCKSIIFVILLIISFDFQSVSAKDKVKFDVKTKFAEGMKILSKRELAAAKSGTMAFLRNSTWATVCEKDEDYSLWLKNHRRSIRGNKTVITLDLEIHTPASLLDEGKLLESESINVLYSSASKKYMQYRLANTEILHDITVQLGGADNLSKYVGFLRKSLRSGSKANKAFCVLQGGLFVLEAFMPADTPAMRLEAIMVGAKVGETVYGIFKSPEPIGKIQKIWVDFDVFQNGDKGLLIHLKFSVYNLKDVNCRASAYFFFQSKEPLRDYNNLYTSYDEQVSVSDDFKPIYSSSIYEDFELFMPYDELHLEGGRYDLMFDVILYDNSTEFTFAQSDYFYFNFYIEQ